MQSLRSYFTYYYRIRLYVVFMPWRYTGAHRACGTDYSVHYINCFLLCVSSFDEIEPSTCDDQVM